VSTLELVSFNLVLLVGLVHDWGVPRVFEIPFSMQFPSRSRWGMGACNAVAYTTGVLSATDFGVWLVANMKPLAPSDVVGLEPYAVV
jgi:hypothetical protein